MTTIWLFLTIWTLAFLSLRTKGELHRRRVRQAFFHEVARW